MATWNIRSIANKERELVQEFEKMNLDILAITETKKKGKGIRELEGGHIMIYSGVPMENRAAEGVGFIIRKNLLQQLVKYDYVSERILRIEMRLEEEKETTLVVAYGPNEDERVQQKEEFWEKLSETVEDSRHRVVVLGDFNSRVGKSHNTGDVIGHHGEDHRNSNGTRLIDFCVENNFIVTNTFFDHKYIHKITREVTSRKEASIIDYVLISRNFRKDVLDVRVKRGPEIGSDHYMLAAKLKLHKRKNFNTTNMIQDSKYLKKIKTYKLLDKDVAERYRKSVTEQCMQTQEKWREMDVKRLWTVFKNIVISSAENACGVSSMNKSKKQTRWWSDEIKRQVKIKKEKWNAYMDCKTAEKYDEYKKERIKTKEMVIKAKKDSWEEFGRKMEQDSKGNQKLFYRVLKGMKNPSQYHLQNIKDKNNDIITEGPKIMERWRQYYHELLNTGITNNSNSEGLMLTQEKTVQIREQDKIQVEEVTEIVNALKRGKSAGHDGIAAEMLKHMGDSGTEMFTELLNKAWEEKQVPDDWKIGIIIPIYKKGDSMDCNNYRGITLLSVPSKVYERLLDKKLREHIERDLDGAQSGFRKGHSIQDHIFTIKQGDGTMEVEIKERLMKASKLYHTLRRSFICKKEISRKTKITVYKTIFRPVLTFGSESWLLSDRQKSKIQALEMKYLRVVKGVTRRDKIRNEVIRSELGVKSVLQKIEETQLKWFGHLVRMDVTRPVKMVWQAREQRKRGRGRPRKTWNDTVASILKSRGLSWNEAFRRARDKKKWASFKNKNSTPVPRRSPGSNPEGGIELPSKKPNLPGEASF
nr:unnamed protein product [Callosobruchus chinensis]